VRQSLETEDLCFPLKQNIDELFRCSMTVALLTENTIYAYLNGYLSESEMKDGKTLEKPLATASMCKKT
jgi:hypothetical protein